MLPTLRPPGSKNFRVRNYQFKIIRRLQVKILMIIFKARHPTMLCSPWMFKKRVQNVGI